MIGKIIKFIAYEKIYLLMAVFIVVVHFSVIVPSPSPEQASALQEAGEVLRVRLSTKEGVAELFGEKSLALSALAVALFLGFLALLSGSVLTIIFIVLHFRGIGLLRKVKEGESAAPWGFRGIARIIIVYLFFINLFKTFFLASPCKESILPALKMIPPRALTSFLIFIPHLLGLSIMLYFMKRKYRRGIDSLGLFRERIKYSISRGAVAYLTLLPALFAAVSLSSFVMGRFQYRVRPNPAVEFFWQESDPVVLVLLIFLVGIFGPVIEELFFRGFVYKGLRKHLGIGGAIFLSSLFFAAVHLNLASFFPILILGVGLAYTFEKTGSLLPAITIHALVNSATMFFLFLLKSLAL